MKIVPCCGGPVEMNLMGYPFTHTICPLRNHTDKYEVVGC